MIKAMISNKSAAVVASGSTKELAAEVCALVGSMWSAMKKETRTTQRRFG